MKLGDVFEQFLRTNRSIRSKHTERLYRLAIRQFGESLGHEPTIDDLSDDALVGMEKYLSDRSPYTVNERLGRVKAVWRFAAKKGIVTVWPTLGNLPEDPPITAAWSIDELRALMRACERQTGRVGQIRANLFWCALLRFLWDSGERAGVVTRLRWAWLGPRGLDVPGASRKDKKPAFYRLSQPTVAAIDAIRHPDRDLIFEWPHHLATLYNRYSRILKQAGLAYDRKSKFQRVRRSHLTHWHAAGYDATARAQHSSTEITKKHYLDQSLLPQIDPSEVLPPL